MPRKRGRSRSLPRRASCRPYSIEPLEPRTLFSTYPNVLVNNPALDTTSADTQSTTAVIAFGSTVLVAYTDSGSTNGGTSHYIGYARSIDQGQSFTDLGRLPDSTKGDGTEPSLARDNFSGAIYLASRSSASKGVQIFKSVDNGLTFTLMATVLAGGLGQQVMPNIAVDNFPGAGQGNIYVGYRTVGPPNGMTFSCSTNGGASFTTTSVNLQGNSTGFDGAHIVVGPDHAVFYFWYNGTTGTSKISLIKSTDQGATFSPLITVATLAVIPAGVSGFIGTTESSAADLGLPFQTFAYPQAVVNPLTGDLYVVYPDKTATTGTDIFLTQSTDAGQTWSTPYRVNDDTTANDQWQPSLSIKPDGSELFVGFYDRRNDPANTLIDTYGAIADITGPSLTWRPNFRITTTSFSPVFGVDPTVDSAISSRYMGDYDNSYADNSGFYYAWGDNRDASLARAGNQANVRFAKITNTLAVASSTPAPDSNVLSPPNDFIINLTDPYDPASVQASDLTVNGIPADSVTLTGASALAFHFNTSPVTAIGPQTIAIADGAITRLPDGSPIQAFTGVFDFGVTPLAVASTVPGVGSTLSSPPTHFIINLSDIYDPATVQASDFTVNGSPANFFSFLSSTSIEFDFATPPAQSDGDYLMAIPAAAISGLNTGISIQAFSGVIHYSTALTVLSTVPAAGSSTTSAITNFVVNFSAPYDPATVQPGDLTVNGVPADSVSLISASSLTFHYNNSPSANVGTQSMSISSGAIAKGIDGSPIQAFTAAFTHARSSAPTAVDLLAASDSGVSGADNITDFNNSSPARVLQFSISGTIAGATVTVYANGVAVGTALAAGATTTVTTAGAAIIADGQISFTARQTPVGQLQSIDSTSLTVTILTTTPAAPAQPPRLQAGSDSGISSSDGITNIKKPTFDVTGGTPYFTFYLNGVQVGGTYNSGTSITLPTQADGTWHYSFSIVDVAGNTSAMSPLSSAITIDTVAPAPPPAPVLEPSDDRGISQSDGVTNVANPIVDLVAGEAGALQVELDGAASGSISTPATGTYSFTASGINRQLAFDPDVTYSTDKFNTQDVITADVNGDGVADLIEPCSTSNVFDVLLGNGDGTFKPKIAVPTGAAYYVAAAGDFNHDANADIVLSDENQNLSVFMSTGNGTFAPPVKLAATGATFGVPAIGDFNGDGNMDVAVLDEIDGKIPAIQTDVFLGHGDGTFSSLIATPLGKFGTSIAAADFNHDGLTDLAFYTYTANLPGFLPGYLKVCLSNGNGTFSLGPAQSVVNAYGMAVADFNGDSRPDVTLNLGDFISFYPGVTNNTIGAQTKLVGTANMSSLTVADINQDGYPDLVVTGDVIGSTMIGVFLGSPAGLGPFRTLTTLNTTAYGICVGDLNGDGAPDLICVENQEIHIVLADPASGLADGPHTISAYAEDAAGNISAPSPALTVTIDTTAPVVDIPPVVPEARDSGLPSIEIDFSEPVYGLDISQLTLLYNDSPIPLNGAILTTTDNIHWTLANLTALTSATGDYTIQLDPTSTIDAAGNLTANAASASFSVRSIDLVPELDNTVTIAPSSVPGMTDIFINSETPTYTWNLSAGTSFSITGASPGVNSLLNAAQRGFGFGSNIGTATIDIQAGQLVQTGDLGAAGNVILNIGAGGAALFNTTQHLAALNITGGSASIAPGSDAILVTQELSLAQDARLDLADNAMIVDYTGNSPTSTIASDLAAGFNAGAWDGAGIDSSAAGADPAHLHAIGYAEAADLDLSSFMGIPVDPTTIVMRYTKYGDNNLDGTVDIGNDFSLYLDGLVNKNASSWVQGDYTFDGKVDLGNDANLFLRSYLTPAVSTPAAQIAAAPALKVNPITSPFTLDNSQSPLDWTLNEI